MLKTSTYKPNKTMVSVTYSRASGRKRDARRRGPRHRRRPPTVLRGSRAAAAHRRALPKSAEDAGSMVRACVRPCAGPSWAPTWSPDARVAVGAPTSSRHRARCLLVFFHLSFYSFPFLPDARIWVCGSRDVLHPIKCRK